MPATLNPLLIRQRLGRKQWGVPERFGPDGWKFDHLHQPSRIIVSVAPQDDGVEWIHASMSHDNGGRIPTYEDLLDLHHAVFGAGWAYHVFAPRTEHVNIHEVLHLWGRLDGEPALPNFGRFGTI